MTRTENAIPAKAVLPSAQTEKSAQSVHQEAQADTPTLPHAHLTQTSSNTSETLQIPTDLAFQLMSNALILVMMVTASAARTENSHTPTDFVTRSSSPQTEIFTPSIYFDFRFISFYLF
jgi:hypothetical protein